MKNFFKNLKPRKVLMGLVFGLVGTILILALAKFTGNFLKFKHDGYMSPAGSRHSAVPFNPDQVRGWMTFRYINSVFRLPPDYLKNTLEISDKRYPNISVNSLAKTRKQDGNQMVVKTLDAVKAYFKPNAQ